MWITIEMLIGCGGKKYYICIMKIGDIYYFSENGCRFIKILNSEIINGEEWVEILCFTKISILDNTEKTLIYKDIAGKQKIKLYHLEKLSNKYSFISEFKGCVKMEEDELRFLNSNSNLRLEKYPFLKFNKFLNDSQFMCKKIDKQEYRSMLLSKIIS